MGSYSALVFTLNNLDALSKDRRPRRQIPDEPEIRSKIR